MPLSLNKLDRLLSQKGFLTRNIYTMHNSCVYIEIFSVITGTSFMLYVQSKYNIKVEGGESVYKINFINVNENGHIPLDYAGEPDDIDLEDQYEQVELDLNHNIQKTNLTDKLEENYNHPISLKDIDKTDIKHLREIYRQLRRLRLCVQNIKYKLCIIYKNYICCIRRDDTFEGFMINNYPLDGENSHTFKLYITLDLESLYTKMDSINIDIQTVRTSIYKVLDRNQQRHSANLTKMLEEKMNMSLYSSNIYKKKQKYTEYMNKLQDLLKTTIESEKKIILKLQEIDNRYNEETSIRGLHSDISKTHERARLEKELSHMSSAKHQIIQNLVTIKNKYEDLTLQIDKILFDNSIMIDALLKNLLILSELSK